MITSGLRVFDIEDLLHPREIAYFVAPPEARLENGLMASDFAMSRPEFAPERHEIWYTDGPTGLYVLRLDPSAWPAAADPHLQRSTTTRRTRSGMRVNALVGFDHEGEGPMPVPGATVTVGGHRATTDATGRAVISLHRTKRRRRLSLVAAKAGFAPARAPVTGGR